MISKEARVYDIISKKAGSNIGIQTLSGIAGFPFTLLADISVFFTHYGPMLREIRNVYGRGPVEDSVMRPIIKVCKKEMIADLVVDKIIGNLPLIGAPANALCAKAMTWRLGLLFGMLASRGEEIDEKNVRSAIVLIREVFPQTRSAAFRNPSAVEVEKLLKAVEGISTEECGRRLEQILDAYIT